MSTNMMSLIGKLTKKCNAIDKEIMESFNLTQSEYQFLTNIPDCSELNSAQIAIKMGLSLSRISRIIEKLVQKDYLIRNLNKNDRRAIKLCLSEQGIGIRNEILQRKKECETEMFKGISKEERMEFELIVNKIVKSEK